MPRDEKNPDYARGYLDAIVVMARAVVAAEDNSQDLLRRHLDGAIRLYKAAGGDSSELDMASLHLQEAYDRINAGGEPHPPDNQDPSPDAEAAGVDEDTAPFQPSPGAQQKRHIPPAIWPKNPPTPGAVRPGRA